MASLGLNFSPVSLLSRHNQDHLDAIQAFAKNLGVPVKFKPINCSPDEVAQKMLPAAIKQTDNWVGRKYATDEDYAERAHSGGGGPGRSQVPF